MAAISAALSLVKQGEHIICSDDTYGGTVKQLNDSVSRLGVKVDYINLLDLDGLKKALKPETKVQLEKFYHK